MINYFNPLRHYCQWTTVTSFHSNFYNISGTYGRCQQPQNLRAAWADAPAPCRRGRKTPASLPIGLPGSVRWTGQDRLDTKRCQRFCADTPLPGTTLWCRVYTSCSVSSFSSMAASSRHSPRSSNARIEASACELWEMGSP